MFDKFFTFIRRGVKEAILGGIDDANAEIRNRLEFREPITIEGEPETNGNGKATGRRKAVR